MTWEGEEVRDLLEGGLLRTSQVLCNLLSARRLLSSNVAFVAADLEALDRALLNAYMLIATLSMAEVTDSGTESA